MKNLFYRIVAVLLASLACVLGAHAQQDYPSKPIRLVVGYAPGGPTDAISRLVAQEMAITLGQPIVVENKGAASSMVATRETKVAPADGYHLLIAAVGHNVNPILHGERAGYDPHADFAPVANIATTPLIVVTAYESPWNTMGELADTIRSRPQSVTFGSSGNGGSGHLAGELLATAVKRKMLHVPFRGSSAALLDVMARRVDFMFYPIVGVEEQRAAKKLRPLAVATAERLPQFPDVPTMREVGLSGFEETAPWIGMFAPAKTPPAIVEKLNAALVAALAKPDIRARIEKMGGVVAGGSSSEFAAYLERDFHRWQEVIKTGGVTAD